MGPYLPPHSQGPPRTPHPGGTEPSWARALTPSSGGNKTTRPDKHMWGRPWAQARPQHHSCPWFPSSGNRRMHTPHSAGPKSGWGEMGWRELCPPPLRLPCDPTLLNFGIPARNLQSAHPLPHPALYQKLLSNFILLQCLCVNHHPPNWCLIAPLFA